MSDGADGFDGGHGSSGETAGSHDGFGVSDLDVGHGHGGYGTDPSDAGRSRGFFKKLSPETLMVGHSHCDPKGWNGDFTHVSVDINSGTQDDGVPVATYGSGDGHRNADEEQEFRRKVREALEDPRRRFYGAHVVCHGQLDVPKLFREAALAAGLIRICNRMSHFPSLDQTKYFLTDWSGAVNLAPMDEKFLTPLEITRRTGCRVPAGYYEGAIGCTRVWRQFWQVGKRRSVFPWNTELEVDRNAQTYLEVNITTWYYGQACDFETRLEMRIVSLPVYKFRPDDPKQGDWYWKHSSWKAHQAGCDKVLKALFVELQKAPPSELAKMRRHAIIDAARKKEQEEQEEQGKPGKDGIPTDKLPPADKPLPVPVDESEPRLPPVVKKFRADDEVEAAAGTHSGADLDSFFADLPEPKAQAAVKADSAAAAPAAAVSAEDCKDGGGQARVTVEVPLLSVEACRR